MISWTIQDHNGHLLTTRVIFQPKIPLDWCNCSLINGTPNRDLRHYTVHLVFSNILLVLLCCTTYPALLHIACTRAYCSQLDCFLGSKTQPTKTEAKARWIKSHKRETNKHGKMKDATSRVGTIRWLSWAVKLRPKEYWSSNVVQHIILNDLLRVIIAFSQLCCIIQCLIISFWDSLIVLNWPYTASGSHAGICPATEWPHCPNHCFGLLPYELLCRQATNTTSGHWGTNLLYNMTGTQLQSLSSLTTQQCNIVFRKGAAAKSRLFNEGIRKPWM